MYQTPRWQIPRPKPSVMPWLLSLFGACWSIGCSSCSCRHFANVDVAACDPFRDSSHLKSARSDHTPTSIKDIAKRKSDTVVPEISVPSNLDMSQTNCCVFCWNHHAQKAHGSIIPHCAGGGKSQLQQGCMHCHHSAGCAYLLWGWDRELSAETPTLLQGFWVCR